MAGMSWEGLTPPYRTIVADPPWPLEWDGAAGGKHRRSTPLSYSVMPVDEIAAMPVGELVQRDAHLFLWVIPKLNREWIGVQVARAWGFSVVSEIIWEKPNFGVGQLPRNCHEVLLVCRRGSLSLVGEPGHSFGAAVASGLRHQRR